MRANKKNTAMLVDEDIEMLVHIQEVNRKELEDWLREELG